MSQEAVNQVILKALSDAGFREQLFFDPAAALVGFDLSGEEHQALSSLQRESFDIFASEIEQRISKSSLLSLGRIPHYPLNPNPERY
jgi:hypothetical protein